MLNEFKTLVDTGFDMRMVKYEEIHGIKEVDFDALVNAINPLPRQVVLDGMCGYGAVARGVLEKVSDVKVYLLDESSVQVQRAINNLPCLPSEYFITKSIIDSGFEDQIFDTVAIKMGIHEVPKDVQPEIFKEVYRLLKPGGKFVVWDIMLQDETVQKLFQDIIRKKDELAGFFRLTEQRYFFAEREFLENVNNAGFNTKNEPHNINYRFSSKKRLESELGGELSSLENLNYYIRGRFPEALKETMGYSDSGVDIQFSICKKIYTLVKHE